MLYIGHSPISTATLGILLMHPTSLCMVLTATLCLATVSAQSGNELIFVGTSTSGTTDNHAFAESGTGGLFQQGPSNYTDNVSGAVWANGGRKLYCSQSLMCRISVADWDAGAGAWSFSTFHQFPNSVGNEHTCYGVQFDPGRNRLWTLTGPSVSARELVCLDADPQSANYGNVIAQTTSLGGSGIRERWCLSLTGNLACVPLAIIGGYAFTLVNLDPSSPNYLSVTTTGLIPGASTAGIAIANSCKISVDELYVYVLYAGTAGSGMAVWDVAAQAWLDFDPAPLTQDLAIPFSVPNKMDLPIDRSFAVVSGQGGTGWVARVDFDYQNPVNTTITNYGLTVPNCNGASLSPDGTRAAVTSTATFLSAPSELTVFDVSNGAVLNTTPLSIHWNVYTTAWQDASPVATYDTFGTGCPGTLGTPALAPTNNSRPALGSTLNVGISNLPFGLALMATGFSISVTSAGVPLPLDLGIIGMPTCNQLVDAPLLDVVTGPGTTANWSWSIPNDPNIFGFMFFNQAFALDPAANAFGFTASNAASGKLGY